MPGHLSSIGFHPASEEQFVELAQYGARHGQSFVTQRGEYVRWSPGAGAELWVQRNKRSEVIGCNPHFAATGHIRAGVISPPIQNKKWPLDGSLYCWAGATDDNPENGLPMVVDVPDFDLIQARIIIPTAITVQVAAFAHELSCFPNDEEYAASQSGSMKFASEFYIPSGTFTPDLETRDPLQAEAIFAGHILESELRTNPYTERQFYYLSVKTLPGVLDVVADPELVATQPVEGGVVQGSFWLSARVISDLPPAKNKGLLGKLFSRM